jgi:hypothetical protein
MFAICRAKGIIDDYRGEEQGSAEKQAAQKPE